MLTVATPAEPTRTSTIRSRAAAIALWGLQAITALGFVAAAAAKFTGAAQIQVVFAAIGAGSWLMYAVAVLEIAGAVGLLIPRLCGPAATAFVALMSGALATHAAVGGFAAPAAVMFSLAALIAWVRRRDTAALVHRIMRTY